MTDAITVSRQVDEAITSSQLSPKHAGAAQLARRYAQLIDESRDTEEAAKVLGDLGPKLLATLTALGLTVVGRTEAGRGGVASGPASGSDPANPVDRLRDRASTRRNGAANLHIASG